MSEPSNTGNVVHGQFGSASSAERNAYPATPVPVRYEADDRGISRTAVEYTNPGVVNLSKVPGISSELVVVGGEALITTESGNEHFFFGGVLWDMAESERQGKRIGTGFGNFFGLPEIPIDLEPWSWTEGKSTGEPVKKVEVATGELTAGEGSEDEAATSQYEERGASPFESAFRRLRALPDTDAQVEPAQAGPNPEGQSKLAAARNRIRRTAAIGRNALAGAVDYGRDHLPKRGAKRPGTIGAEATPDTGGDDFQPAGVNTTNGPDWVMSGSPDDTDPDPVAPEDVPSNEDILKRLTAEAWAARVSYAKLAAGRGRRFGLGTRGFSKEALADARNGWEKSKEALTRHERDMALKAGVSLEDLDTYAESFAIADAEIITEQLHDERLKATGWYGPDPSGVTARLQVPLKRQLNKLYAWWEKQSDAKLLSKQTLKKSGAMVAAGVVVGVPAALAGSFILGPIAGGAVGAAAASKIAKSAMRYRLDRSISSSEHHVRQLNNDLLHFADNGRADDIADLIDAQTHQEVKGNRRLLYTSIGTAAVGGVLGGVLGELFGGGSGSHAVSGRVTSVKPQGSGNGTFSFIPKSIFPKGAPISPEHHQGIHHGSGGHDVKTGHGTPNGTATTPPHHYNNGGASYDSTSRGTAPGHTGGNDALHNGSNRGGGAAESHANGNGNGGATMPPEHTTHANPKPHTTRPSHHAKPHRADSNQSGATDTLGYSGDTIWHEVSNDLHEHGVKTSNRNILKATRAVLKARGLSWEGARHLPVGYRFAAVSQHLIDKLKTK